MTLPFLTLLCLWDHPFLKTHVRTCTHTFFVLSKYSFQGIPMEDLLFGNKKLKIFSDEYSKSKRGINTGKK